MRPNLRIEQLNDCEVQRPHSGDPLFPQLDKQLYRMLTMMTQVYAIEMFAKRTFEWGIALLSDPSVSAAPKAAGEMVRFIQADEAPHVQYLRTALSEARARTLRCVDGSVIAGGVVIDGLLHAMLVRSIDARPREQRGETRGYLERAVSEGKASAGLLEEFDALAPSFAPPSKTGFEPVAA